MKLPADYLVLAVISPGPAARVLLARAPDGREVIVKQAAINRAVPAIAHEARVLGTLESGGVAGVPRLLGQWDGGIALERLAHGTLASEARAMSSDAAFRLRATQATFDRLDAVHRAGVVHGDVSPDNVLLSADGTFAALADFGLSRTGADWDDAHDGSFRGTLLYAAPEVARGEFPTLASDVFALAASVLHVATGTPLRDSHASPASVLVAAGSRPFDASHPWHREASALFPAQLVDTLFRCLAFDPEGRPRDARLCVVKRGA
jgi:serine/threonine protein kinase